VGRGTLRNRAAAERSYLDQGSGLVAHDNLSAIYLSYAMLPVSFQARLFAPLKSSFQSEMWGGQDGGADAFRRA
jgi:hypothetical protein